MSDSPTYCGKIDGSRKKHSSVNIDVSYICMYIKPVSICLCVVRAAHRLTCCG